MFLRWWLLIFLVLLIGSRASGQNLTLGAVVGTNLTRDVRSGAETANPSPGVFITDTAESGPRLAILGLKLEYGLRANWSIEADALHREMCSTTTSSITLPAGRPTPPGINPTVITTETLATWEFPILVKYRLPRAKLNPFVAGGASFRPAGKFSQLSHQGFTTGAGLEFRAGGVRFAPTLRYTRWLASDFVYNTGIGRPLLNQVELLVAIDRPSAGTGLRVFGKDLSLGVIAGVGLGDDFQVRSSGLTQTSDANSGIYGLLIETDLPKDWSLEVDGLYRALHGADHRAGQTFRFAHLTWEFPVLLKYRFLNGVKWRPLLEAGPSFRAEGNVNLQSASHFGATAGGGIEFRLGRLPISPVVRYTRWGAGNSELPRTWANQVQVLVSVRY